MEWLFTGCYVHSDVVLLDGSVCSIHARMMLRIGFDTPSER